MQRRRVEMRGGSRDTGRTGLIVVGRGWCAGMRGRSVEGEVGTLKGQVLMFVALGRCITRALYGYRRCSPPQVSLRSEVFRGESFRGETYGASERRGYSINEEWRHQSHNTLLALNPARGVRGMLYETCCLATRIVFIASSST